MSFKLIGRVQPGPISANQCPRQSLSHISASCGVEGMYDHDVWPNGLMLWVFQPPGYLSPRVLDRAIYKYLAPEIMIQEYKIKAKCLQHIYGFLSRVDT